MYYNVLYRYDLFNDDYREQQATLLKKNILDLLDLGSDGAYFASSDDDFSGEEDEDYDDQEEEEEEFQTSEVDSDGSYT